MSLDALSPRHRESPLTRRSRDIPPPTSNCLEVQWRFLQHKNPKPPQFGSPQRKPLLVNPITPRAVRSNASSMSLPGSPSRLFHMFERQDVEAEEVHTGQTAPQQTSDLPESPRASRTLNDLMGETQRQAMLDRILADMEDLAVEPTYARLGQPEGEKGAKASSPRYAQRARSHKPSILQIALRSDPNAPKNRSPARQRKFSALWSLSQAGYSDDMDDDDDDDDGVDDSDGQSDWDGHGKDRKRRQRRKLQHLNQEDEGPRIFWQKTTGAVSAADVPQRLLALSPSPPHRLRSSGIIVLGRRSHTSRQPPSPSAKPEGRQHSNHSTDLPTCNARPPSPNSRLPAAPDSPAKAHYGAWYVPQSEWWALRQMKQQNVADKLPASATATSKAIEPHCHGGDSSPARRHHKPTLPTAQSRASKPATSRAPSASPAPPSAPELQAAAIPQSYIGREYRAYIVSTGSAMPQYLQ
ncbi:hypothetical protein PRIC1_014639 [Phytophthora ramorum]